MSKKRYIKADVFVEKFVMKLMVVQRDQECAIVVIVN